jgi:GT2 family glycosyltransferase
MIKDLPMDVSIIIVNYNTKVLLQHCLESIYKFTKDIDFEIIVSDNGSQDGSIEMIKSNFQKVILIENNKNLGFGVANNEALKIANGEYLFLLNSDTVIFNNAIKLFYDFYTQNENKYQLGVIGCNLVDKEYNIIHSYDNFPNISKILLFLSCHIPSLYLKTFLSIFNINNVKFQPERKSSGSTRRIGIVDYVTGADLFIKKENMLCFDKRFFLYSEEVDLQYRLLKNGKKSMLIDGPIIQHLIGGSNNYKDNYFDTKYSFQTVHYYISQILYFKKYNYSITSILLLKFFVLVYFCNPFYISKTYKYIPLVLKA